MIQVIVYWKVCQSLICFFLDQDGHSTQGLIIGIITLCVIIFLVSLCFYVRYRVKRARAAHLHDEVIFRSGNNAEPTATISTRNYPVDPLMHKGGYPMAVELPPPQPYPGGSSIPPYPYDPPSYDTGNMMFIYLWQRMASSFHEELPSTRAILSWETF